MGELPGSYEFQVSIMSLAYGLSEWLEIGVDERIFLHTFWYHHLCRTCYFTVPPYIILEVSP